MVKIIELAEFRCHCGKLLCKEYVIDGTVELWCEKCEKLITLNTTPAEEPSKTCELKEGVYYAEKK